MMSFTDVPVFVHKGYVDFRKQINGLSALVASQNNQDIFQPGIFVFCNKGRDKIKVLYWERNGFCLWQKRLERDRFIWPRQETAEVLHWNQEQFDWLLRGFDVGLLTPHSTLKYSSI